MTTATLNGDKPQRKQLSEQLDRLDNILDTLSEGLNGAVADAAGQAIHLALKDALVEIMTDPNLRARLHQATAPESPHEPSQPAKRPGFWARLKAKAGQTVAAVGHTVSQAVHGAARRVQAIAAAAAEKVRAIGDLGRLKELVQVGLGIGMVVGLASYLAPHAMAALVAGISGAVAATAVKVGVWTRQAFHALTKA